MAGWTSGNELELLENGEEYFPRLCAEVEAAAEEIVLETYIWYEDEISTRLAHALIDAARRGVGVTITVDGYGSPAFSDGLLTPLRDAGITVRSFDARRPLLRIRTNMFCRLHRKIVVIDRKVAFVGGINVWALHLRRFGSESMQDYAVRVTGPVVSDIYEATQHLPAARPGALRRRWRNRGGRARRARRELGRPPEDAQVAFVARDNDGHRRDIEMTYRAGIRAAKEQILIANAYFFPGYRFLRDLTQAARRGLDVRLVLQGKPDVAISAVAASMLYTHLFSAGVRIYHYKDRALHAKVAVIDGTWATVGSSNLDPVSLGLNLEANLFVRDEAFASALRRSLLEIIETACEEVTTEVPRKSLMRRLLLMIVYHATRHMPDWGRLLRRRGQAARAMQGPDERSGHALE